MTKNTINVQTLAIIVLGLAVVYLGYGFLNEPATPSGVPPTPPATVLPAASSSSAGTVVAATGASHTGTLDIIPLSRTSTSYAGASKAVLLDPVTHWKGDESATRYDVMRIYQEGGGTDGLTGAFGSSKPEEKSQSSGKFTYSSMQAHVGDEFLIYTYQDTSYAAGENTSKVVKAKLTNFEEGTGNWVWEVIEGEYKGKNSWPLYNFATYNWVDSSYINRTNVSYGDSGTAATDRVIRWYSNSTLQGEGCVDCLVIINAPKNFTGKFKNLIVSDGTKSHKYTTLKLASNAPSPIDIISTLSTIPAVTTNNELYVPVSSDGSYGYIGDLNTRRTSDSEKTLTWELKTDTYGSNVSLIVYLIQNGKSPISTNVPFRTPAQLDVMLRSTGLSGFDQPST